MVAGAATLFTFHEKDRARWRHRRGHSPAFVAWDDDTIFGIVNFDFDGQRIAEINSVLNPDKLAFAQRQVSATA